MSVMAEAGVVMVPMKRALPLCLTSIAALPCKAARGGAGGSSISTGGGGGGGNGITIGDGSTIFNSGSISGGTGGVGGNSSLYAGGGGGGGGHGIVGNNLVINNSGSISGGLGGVGGTGPANGLAGSNGDAILFTGDNNTLNLDSGSVLNGAVEVASGATATIGVNTTGLDLSGGALGSSALIANGATTIDTGSNNFAVSGIISGDSLLTKQGSGTLTLSGANTWSGGLTISNGTVQVGSSTSNGSLGTGSVTDNAALLFNNSTNSTFANTISGNGSATAGGTGTLTYTGNSTGVRWTATSGTLQVSNGGVINSPYFTDNANVVVDGATSSITNTAGNMLVGGGGTGSLTVQNGALVHSNGELEIGQHAGDTGTVTVTGSGSTLSTSASMNIGQGGTGTLVVSNGGTVSDNGYFSIADQPGNTQGSVIVTGAGSSVTAQTVAVGNHANTGSGTLTLSDGGAITATNGFFIASDAGVTGTVNIGAAINDTATAPGTLNAPTVAFGNGYGTLVFNHTSNSYTFAPQITGTGSIRQVAGTTILTGANTYTGGTTIGGGTLSVSSENNLGDISSSVTLSGGTLENTAEFTTSRNIYISGIGAIQTDANLIDTGNIAGDGALIKSGGATLTLNSNSGNFVGPTTVQAGTLEVGDANSPWAKLGGDVSVQSGGTLRGHGSIGGNVNNAGTVFPGGSVGILTINGNYTQAANGVLTAQVLPSTNPVAGVDYDQLHVLGQASLNGTLNVLVNSGQFTVGTHYDLVKADGGLSGQFSQVAYNPAFAAYITPTVQYSANNATLQLTPTPGATPTPTPGLAYSSANAAVAQPWITQHSLLAVGDVLDAAPRFDSVTGRHVWLRALKGQGGANAASVDQNGVVLGATAALSDDWSAGIAFAHTQTETQTTLQSVRGRGNGLYALGNFQRGAWWVDSSVGFGRTTQDSTRYLNPTGLVASGSTHGWYGSAAVTARYRHDLSKTIFIEPYAGAAFVHSNTQAFSESGAGLLDLAYAARSQNLGRFTAGLTTGLHLVSASGVSLKPWIRAGVAAYAGDVTTHQDLSLGTLDQSISANGAPRTALTTGAGITMMTPSKRWEATLGYAGEFSHNSHFNGAEMKVTYRW